jgi:hypothetical protein
VNGHVERSWLRQARDGNHEPSSARISVMPANKPAIDRITEPAT